MGTSVRPSRTAARATAFILMVGVGLSGCQQGGSSSAQGSASGEPSVTQTKEVLPAATLAVNVPAGATDVRPDTVVTVASTRGTLENVAVSTADGKPVDGTLSGDKTSWRANSGLAVATDYKVNATATNPDGQSTPLTSQFKTLTPSEMVQASITPSNNLGQVGVAMPVVVLFDEIPVDRAAAERKLTIKTDRPIEGSWHWMSDKQVVYRPKAFWPSGTKVDVTANMTGVEFADNSWGEDTAPVHFEIGRNQETTVDIANHTMTVKRDGKEINTIPVTTGMGRTGKYATRNGMKVIITKENSHRMVAPGQSEDSAEYYDLVVKYAMRLTWSGEFIHAAPWSTWAHGKRNVSHGCVGASTKNAKWMMDNSLIGDPVNFVGGERGISPDNGWAFWNVDYNEWKKGSALYDPNRAEVESGAPSAPAAPSATESAAPSATPSASPTATTTG